MSLQSKYQEEGWLRVPADEHKVVPVSEATGSFVSVSGTVDVTQLSGAVLTYSTFDLLHVGHLSCDGFAVGE